MATPTSSLPLELTEQKKNAYNRDAVSDKQGFSCVTRWGSLSVRRASLMVGSRTTRQHPRGPDGECVFW